MLSKKQAETFINFSFLKCSLKKFDTIGACTESTYWYNLRGLQKIFIDHDHDPLCGCHVPHWLRPTPMGWLGAPQIYCWTCWESHYDYKQTSNLFNSTFVFFTGPSSETGSVLRIRVRRNRMSLGLLDSNLLVRAAVPDSRNNLDSYCFCDFLYDFLS